MFVCFQVYIFRQSAFLGLKLLRVGKPKILGLVEIIKYTNKSNNKDEGTLIFTHHPPINANNFKPYKIF